MRLNLVGLGLTAATLLIAACGGGGDKSAPAAGSAVAPGAAAVAAGPTESFPGRYVGSGGGGAMAVLQALVDAFGKQHPEMSWVLQNTSSDLGIAAAQGTLSDIGFTSRDLTSTEADTVQSLPIGAVATAVVVNSASSVKNLTTEQVRQIFTGEITDWSRVGGPPQTIKVLLREKGAATRLNFESFFFDGKPAYTADAGKVVGSDEMLLSLQAFSGSIGMISVTSQTLSLPTIRLLGIDGVAVSKETVLSGAYAVRRPLFIVSHNDASVLRPGVRAFLDFVRGPEGQRVLLQAGF